MSDDFIIWWLTGETMPKGSYASSAFVLFVLQVLINFVVVLVFSKPGSKTQFLIEQFEDEMDLEMPEK